MKHTGISQIPALALMLMIPLVAPLLTDGNKAPIPLRTPWLAVAPLVTVLMPARAPSAPGPDYAAQYPQEYAFFKAAFDQSNGSDFGAERDAAFSMFAQRVEALQKAGAKISLGGMLSLLIYEGQARLAHYNT